MNSFIINKAPDFNSAVKSVVRQSFPFASPSSTALSIAEGMYRGASGMATSRIEGSKRERFTWGISRIGGSFLIG